MLITKRDGTTEEVKFDKILRRVKALSKGLPGLLDPAEVAKAVVAQLRDGISSTEIDNLLANNAATLVDVHPDYSKLAARVAISTLHKETADFYETMKKLDKSEGVTLSEDFMKLVRKFGKDMEDIIDYKRDFLLEYFGFRTLANGYLLKVQLPSGEMQIVERPQHLYARVALQIGNGDWELTKKLYESISLGRFTFATPTLFNSGLKLNQLSSCFLVDSESDSIEGIFNTVKEAASISKTAGGIGLGVSNIRSNGSLIKGTNGHSKGIVPMLKTYNQVANYVDQGGRRKGSIAAYLAPWHDDIMDFLDLKKPTGNDERRARDLFLAVWLPDVFMNRVEQEQDWTLFDPIDVPLLLETFDDKDKKTFTEAYENYEAQGLGKRVVKARDIFKKVIESQLETGTPYVLFQDAINQKCNQKNIGIIKTSNLCCEITEVSNDKETAVCNLASMALPTYIKSKKDGTKYFDFKEFGQEVELAVVGLNKVIDVNYYPTEKARRSNMKHRPIGLGIQGLADVFIRLGLCFGDKNALDLDRLIHETMYYHALKSSMEIAKKEGSYKSFKGSPASKGILQFDMWDVEGNSDVFDWEGLKKDIKEHGLKNSLLTALMPTASTSSILGNSPAFEPLNFVIGKREVLSGEFLSVNNDLVYELEALDMWNEEMRGKILSNGGSIQEIMEIPEEIRKRFRIAREYRQKVIIDHAAMRSPFICQSQSMNLFWEAGVSFGKLYSALLYGWKQGLKTGSYYMRGQASMNARLVTVKPVKKEQTVEEQALVCSIQNPEDCLACGS